MKFSEFIVNLKSLSWLDLSGFLLLFPELDFSRKFGISESSLKTELFKLNLLKRVDSSQERDFYEFIKKCFCPLESESISVQQVGDYLDELASKCKYSTLESGNSMVESKRSRSEIIFDLFNVFLKL